MHEASENVEAAPLGPSERGPSVPPALVVILVHLFLIASFGQYYAKLKLDVGIASIYPTELVLILSLLLGGREIASVPFDGISKAVVGLCVLAAFWVLLEGVGGFDGAGAKAISFFAYSIFYFVVRGATAEPELRARVLRVFAAASIVGAALGAWQMLTGRPLFAAIEGSLAGFELTSTGSTRWLPGEFALYGLFGAMAVIVPMLLERRASLGPTLVLIAAAAELFFAQHRSGFVSLLVALLATVGFLAGSAQAVRRFLGFLLLAAVAIAAFVWLFGDAYIGATIERLSHTGDLTDTNIDWRLLAWFEVWTGIVDRPLGHGFAVWEFLFTLADPLTGSHNSYLDLAYRIGIPGLLVFLAIPYQLLMRTRAAVQSTGTKDHTLLVTVCACLVAFLVFAAFNVVLETPYMSILFWVFAGLAAAALPDQTNVENSALGSATGSGDTTQEIDRSPPSVTSHSIVDAGPQAP